MDNILIREYPVTITLRTFEFVYKFPIPTIHFMTASKKSSI